MNPRIVTHDGEEIPLTLVYVGEEDGLRTWEAPIRAEPGPGWHFACDRLPGRTSIALTVRTPL